MNKRAAILTIAFFLLLSLLGHLGFAPALQAQTDPFYKGKTIRIIGYTTGGVQGHWGRLFALYWKVYSGKSRRNCADHARRGVHNSRELRLRYR